MSVAFSVYFTPQVDKMQAEFQTVRQYMRQQRDPTALSALIPAIKFAVTERQGTYATGGETGNVCPKHHACSHPHAYILVIIFPHYDCILWNDSTVQVHVLRTRL